MPASPRSCLPASLACFAACVATPAGAQPTDYEAIVRVMRQCAKIADIGGRVACYDNTINADAAIASSAGQRATDEPGPPPAPRPTGTPAPAGFGSESLPRAASDLDRPSELRATVTAVVEREPGIYRLTLANGSQWELIEPAPRSYDPPRQGSTVVVSRGIVDNFFLNYERQRPLRVRRIR